MEKSVETLVEIVSLLGALTIIRQLADFVNELSMILYWKEFDV